MKRITTACSILMIVAMLGVTGGRTFAAHQTSPARAMQSVALCSSTPYGVPALQQLSQGIRNGLILATRVWKPKFHAIGVNLAGPYNYDDARSDGVSYGTDQEHANALKCIASNLTYGYIGTLNSGAAQVSEPILNNAGMVQISPANTGPVLTAPSSRASQEPATYHHRLHYVTYYRTVTTDNLQGPTGAQFMKNGLGAHKYFLVDDKTTYGAGLAQQMDLFAQHRLGMTRVGIGHVDPTDASSIAQSSDAIADQVVSAKPDGVYCGCDSENAIALARDLRNKGYTKPVVGGDALVNSSWVKLTGNGSIDNFATSVGPDISKSQPAFRRLYRRLIPGFYANPGPQAYDALSWDASNIALNALYKAIKFHHMFGMGSMFKRRALVSKLVSQTRWKGATGLTTFDRDGDTTNRIISIYAVKSGAWKFLYLARKINGLSPV